MKLMNELLAYFAFAESVATQVFAYFKVVIFNIAPHEPYNFCAGTLIMMFLNKQKQLYKKKLINYRQNDFMQ